VRAGQQAAGQHVEARVVLSQTGGQGGKQNRESSPRPQLVLPIAATPAWIPGATAAPDTKQAAVAALAEAIAALLAAAIVALPAATAAREPSPGATRAATDKQVAVAIPAEATP
jgi:hypothetical protein